ncbi:hypothetical protein [Escherichia coli]
MCTDNTFKSSPEIPCKPSARLQESMRQTEELMAQERPCFENADELGYPQKKKGQCSH